MKIFWTVVWFAAAVFCVGAQQVRSDDQNGDGQADKWFTIRAGVVSEYRADSNFDGVVDTVVRYGRGRAIAYEAYDYNFDGEMDDFYFYQNGMLVRREVDSNYDGAVDLWVFLIDGLYIGRLERDTDHDGQVDQVKDYTVAR